MVLAKEAGTRGRNQEHTFSNKSSSCLQSTHLRGQLLPERDNVQRASSVAQVSSADSHAAVYTWPYTDQA